MRTSISLSLFIVVAVSLFGGAGCKEGTGSLLVNVESDAVVSNVTRLAVQVVQNGQPAQADFRPMPPLSLGPGMSTSLTLVTPADRRGAATVVVEAFDDMRKELLARGSAAVELSPGASSTVTVKLGVEMAMGDMMPPGDMTAPPDMLAPPDLMAPPDLKPVPDLVTVADLTLPPDLTSPPDLLSPPDLTPMMPKSCTTSADCTGACPPGSLGCGCDPMKHCAPTCTTDANCPPSWKCMGAMFCAPPM